MKILSIFAILLMTQAFAGDRTSAYEAICRHFAFESERDQCAAQIRPYNYFEDAALEICTTFSFNSTKMECLRNIGGKQYEPFEIERCRDTPFDSGKLSCLRNSGTPYNNQTCLPRQEILSQLQAAQVELRSGQTGTVDKRLTYLIGKFAKNCQ